MEKYDVCVMDKEQKTHAIIKRFLSFDEAKELAQKVQESLAFLGKDAGQVFFTPSHNNKG